MQKQTSFEAQERRTQSAFRARSETFSTVGREEGEFRGRRYPFIIPADHWVENLHPSLRPTAPRYFAQHKIVWHRMRHHLLSSQVSCVNFLMPLAGRPDILARLLETALQQPVEMEPIEHADGKPVYVAFEYVGDRDYLNEAGGKEPTRGANCTSVDAAVRFRSGGRSEILLIEWKYTEKYGENPLVRGNGTRSKRYADIAFEPDGPVRRVDGLKLEDLFCEPFYQFLRQQMLAYRMETHGCADRVRVLHVTPAANTYFERVTIPKLRARGRTATEAWKSLLRDPDAFIGISTERLFRGINLEDSPELRPWWAYLRDRYAGCLTPRSEL